MRADVGDFIQGPDLDDTDDAFQLSCTPRGYVGRSFTSLTSQLRSVHHSSHTNTPSGPGLLQVRLPHATASVPGSQTLDCMLVCCMLSATKLRVEQHHPGLLVPSSGLAAPLHWPPDTPPCLQHTEQPQHSQPGDALRLQQDALRSFALRNSTEYDGASAGLHARSASSSGFEPIFPPGECACHRSMALASAPASSPRCCERMLASVS